MFIGRLMLILAIVAGLGLAALYALGTLVEPEQSDVQVSIPLPKPQSAPLPQSTPLPKG